MTSKFQFLTICKDLATNFSKCSTYYPQRSFKHTHNTSHSAIKTLLPLSRAVERPAILSAISATPCCGVLLAAAASVATHREILVDT
jgi:hypothetical protein